MEFGKVLSKGNSLVYEAIVLMYNPIMHLFFPFEYLPQRLISTHACSQADTYWLEETQNFKKAKEIIIYNFQIFFLWLIALPMPSFLQVHLIPQWAFFFFSRFFSSSKYTFSGTKKANETKMLCLLQNHVHCRLFLFRSKIVMLRQYTKRRWKRWTWMAGSPDTSG